jgi:hypothetical protein
MGPRKKLAGDLDKQVGVLMNLHGVLEILPEHENTLKLPMASMKSTECGAYQELSLL